MSCVNGFHKPTYLPQSDDGIILVLVYNFHKKNYRILPFYNLT